MQYSKYQQNIFDFIKHGQGNGIIEAVAGSGKTTTIVEALKLIPTNQSVLFIAFNKHIADELAKRVPINCDARTCHSLGFEILRKNMGRLKLNENKVANMLKYTIWTEEERKANWSFVRPICKVISLCKSLYIDYDPSIADILDIDYPPNINWSFGELVWDLFQKDKVIDFDDMIWLPVTLDLKFPKYDWVFVDEAQDLSPIQIEFIYRLVGGRLIAVGDSHQAIYAFRGADTLAMSRLREAYNATELPLSICYRCAKSIVNEAKKLVPHIEAYQTESGLVKIIKEYSLKDNDFVLCRTNAPLVSACLDEIGQGKKAIVRGRDIGESLMELAEELSKKGDFLTNLYDWRNNAVERARTESKKIAIEDKADTLQLLYSKKMLYRIQEIFSNNLTGIIFSSIHKAKGLEAENVYILRPDLLPHPKAKKDWQIEQEKNLKYVAITRAKKNLFYIEE